MRPSGKSLRVSNDADGQLAILNVLGDPDAVLVVLEATGGYEAALVAALIEAKFAVAGVDPRQARDFTKFRGKLAKADKTDAQRLACFAEANRPEPREPADDQTRLLEALVARGARRFSPSR
ncbi:IS110 family transposase [Sorangium sp. So ce1097]|uniref:IS110 family transposase n=1 Tax=Sorangium sp. So ce1097 TaxID=3133330 RepID=UPI003F5ED9B8